VEPLGQSLAISSVMGGPTTSTEAAMTPKGAPLTLLELNRETAPDDTQWVKVLLPVRPNQSTGWVRASDTRQTVTPWELDVHQSRHTLLVWYGRTLLRELSVAVGAPATYTPDGQFFIDVVVDTGNPAGAYGKWILGLNGFSDVYDTFGDGDALIGIHGTDEPASYGHSVSHGCVRAPNPEIAALARLLPLGTPVDISA
jgi:lipoprotein-anchoring transpeptidase ErfK/SrfK